MHLAAFSEHKHTNFRPHWAAQWAAGIQQATDQQRKSSIARTSNVQAPQGATGPRPVQTAMPAGSRVERGNGHACSNAQLPRRLRKVPRHAAGKQAARAWGAAECGLLRDVHRQWNAAHGSQCVGPASPGVACQALVTGRWAVVVRRGQLHVHKPTKRGRAASAGGRTADGANEA